VLFFTSNREAKVRPYVAGGAGIKVFTGGQLRSVGQPFVGSAVLMPATQVEAAISAGAGVKYKVTESIMVRVDFRTYFSPCPDQIFRPTLTSNIHGWIYNFVPLGGISFVF
jgi:outer membrane protein W